MLSPDGGTTTFNYSGAFLSSIQEPGSRTVTLGMSTVSLDQAKLTKITDVDASTRARLAYDADYQLTSDQWAPYNATFAYGSYDNLDSVNQGLGSVYGISPADLAGVGSGVTVTVEGQAIVADALTHATYYYLDGHGRETFEVSQDGATQSWGRNGDGLVTLYTDAVSDTTTYSFNGSGDVLQVNDSDGNTNTYQYDSTYHQVTQEMDYPEGSRITSTVNTYDATGDLSISTVDGAATTYAWSAGLLQTVTDPVGNVTSYSYTDGHRRQNEMDVYNSSSTLVEQEAYTYDARGNPLATTNVEGVTTDTYDLASRLVTETVYLPGGVTAVGDTTYTYYPAGLLSETIDGDGNATITEYDRVGRQTLATIENSVPVVDSQKAFAYDVASRLTLLVDNDATTSYAYDGDGHVIFQKDYGGSGSTPASTQLWSYFANGNVSTYTDPMTNVTTYSWTSHGLETSEATTNTSGTVVRTEAWAYDSHDNQTLHSDPDGFTTLTDYSADTHRHMTSLAVYSGMVTVSTASWAYASNGDQTKAIDGANVTTSYGYDSAGRVTQKTVLDSGGTTLSAETWTYDLNGNQLIYTNPLGMLAIDTYNGLDEIASAVVKTSGGTTLSVEKWGYNLIGDNISDTQVGDPVAGTAVSTVITKSYDPYGNEAQENLLSISGIYSSTINTQIWKYDTADRLATYISDAGITTLLGDDAQGYVTSEEILNSSGTVAGDFSFVHDGRGDPVEAISNNGLTKSDGYDALGDLVSEEVFNGGTVDNSDVWDFDAGGRGTEQTDGVGNTSYNSYDALDNLTQQLIYNSSGTSFSSETWGYDKDSQRTLHIDRAGLKTSDYYDALGNVTSEALYASAGAGTPFSSQTWKYNLNGQLTLSVDAAGITTAQSYDGLGNLTSQTVYNGSQSFSQTWQYDKASHETSHVDQAQVTTEMQYDGLDNVTFEKVYDAGTTFTQSWSYGLLDLLTAHIDRATFTTVMAYDAHNELTLQTVYNAAGTSFSHEAWAYDGAGRETLHTDVASGTTSLIYDLFGNVGTQLAANAWGSTSETWIYDADGRLSQHKDINSNTFTYSYDGGGRRPLAKRYTILSAARPRPSRGPMTTTARLPCTSTTMAGPTPPSTIPWAT